MNILITESQFNRINESTSKKPDLCLKTESYTSFCKKIEKIINGRKGNLSTISSNFFDEVVRNPNFFETITLKPGVDAFDSRLENLKELQTILSNNKSCPEIQSRLQNDIEILPTKGLTMVVDETNQYSLLNRLNSHYTAKSYLLTNLILDSVDKSEGEKIELNDISEDKIIELLKYVMNGNNIDIVSESLFDLLENNKDFREDFMGSLQYSRETGNKIEQEVFNILREKYGEKNVIEFSEDFGFIDYFGIDGILIDGGSANPIQISSSVKTNPKIFEFSSESCTPMGFYKTGNKTIKYTPI